MNIVIGQRWVSHTESNLGLGIITDVSGRIITVSFPAIAETRNYATDNAPLSRIRYAVGDVISNLDEEEFSITEVLEEKGLIGYLCLNEQQQEVLVPELDLNCFVQLSTPRQRLLSGQFAGNSEYRLRFETLKQLNRLQSSSVSGLQGARAELLSHQIYISNEVGKRHAPRVLLADEVGLGKTIEAGLIMHQQIHRGQASRILILVPENLLHQWLVEMLRRFNLPFSLFDEQRINALSEENIDSDPNLNVVNPFETEQWILCSLDMMCAQSDYQQQVLDAHWDLVIVDEAHHLQWSENGTSAEYDFVEKLALKCDGLLLLTATPEQVGIASHFARLRLLDPDRFHDLEKFKGEEQHFKSLNDSVETIQSLIEHLETTEDQQSVDRITQLQSTLISKLPENLQEYFQHAQTDIAKLNTLIQRILDQHGTGRVLFRNTRTAVKGFPERHLNEYPLDGSDFYHQYHQSEKHLSIAQRLHPESNHDDQIWIEEDPRIQWLQQLLKSLRNKKILVICHHSKTAQALDKFLNLRAGIRCTSFYPDLSIVERDRAAAYFAEEDAGAQVLVCSEIGSEGRNFQFAHHLVLFDLPLNPDLIEQRIGRLDRIGQQHTIEIHVPYLKNSAQEILFNWYHTGLDLFQQSCSAGFAIYEQYREKLHTILLAEDSQSKQFTDLIKETTEYAEQLNIKMQQGRDRLLELNSCNPQIAKHLIQQIQKDEQADTLTDYMTQVFDEFGVDHDYHSEHSLVIKPTEHMLSDYFPGLNEDGNSITFDRKKALLREDMEFITWEHPMVVEVMDSIISSDIGNAAVATLSVKGLKPGTLLLETCFTVEKMAPNDLQLHRYLPIEPTRLLFDINGKNLSKVVSHDALNKISGKLKLRIARQVVEQVRNDVDKMIKFSQDEAEQQLPEMINRANEKMKNELGEELQRLKTLKIVNPNIREEEIQFVEHQISESSDYIHRAKLQLQAVRLIINN